jgi:hypothetical protein
MVIPKKYFSSPLGSFEVGVVPTPKCPLKTFRTDIARPAAHINVATNKMLVRNTVEKYLPSNCAKPKAIMKAHLQIISLKKIDQSIDPVTRLTTKRYSANPVNTIVRDVTSA